LRGCRGAGGRNLAERPRHLEGWIVVPNVFAGFIVVLWDSTHYRVDTVDWRLFANASLVYTMYWSNPNETWFARGMPPSLFLPVFASGVVSVLAAWGAVASSL
jgi:hypothetical protein